MTGIKISYANQTKRISENINSYENLIQIVKKLFSLDKLSLLDKNPNQFHLFYLDKDQEKIQVASQEDYIEVCKYHKQSRENLVMKLELFVNNFKDSIFIDQMLDDVKMSESFAVIGKREIFQDDSQFLNQDDLVNETRIINADFDFQASAISKDLEKSVNELAKDRNEQKCSNEKGVQMENFCVLESKFTETENIRTVDVAENTNALEKKDGFAQYEEKSFEENKKIEKNNFDCFNDEDVINIHDDDNDKIIYETTRVKRQENITYQSMNFSEKVLSNESLENQLLSRIDQIIASRLSLLESNFKKYIESSQMNSKLYQPIENVNQVDFTHEQEKSEIKEINNLEKNEDSQALNKAIVNFNLAEEVDQKIEINAKIPDLIDDNGPVFSSLAEPNDDSLSNNNNFHFNDYCSNCKFQILKNKYVCLICDNFHLCSQCESLHLEHPLMKVNINNKIITTRNELEFYFKQQRKEDKNVKKKGGIFKKFGKMFKQAECGINILPKSSTIFAMGRLSKLNYTFAVSSSTKISEEIVVHPVNNKSFQVAPVYLNGLEANKSREVVISLSAPNEVGVYAFEISLTMKNKKFNFSPMKLEIIVSESEDVDEANANLMFGQHDEILKLPKEKKVTLYNLITGQIVKKDFNDVLIIMRKHNYEVDDALNDLIGDENSRAEINKNIDAYYQYSDLQYY